MLFAILGTDATDAAPRRANARRAHLERLQALAAAGRVVVAGPLPEAHVPADGAPARVTGSLIVADFADREAAEAWVADDPYVRDGVFARVTVQPFVRVLP